MSRNIVLFKQLLTTESSRARDRRGVSVLEMSVAATLLMAAMLTTSSFHQRILAGSRAVQQASAARRAVLNAREVIGSWPVADVTKQRIEELTVDKEISSHFAQSRWVANVSDIEEPIAGKQVFIDLQWQNQGQLHTTSGITFWVVQPTADQSDTVEQPTGEDASARLQTSATDAAAALTSTTTLEPGEAAP